VAAAVDDLERCLDGDVVVVAHLEVNGITRAELGDLTPDLGHAESSMVLGKRDDLSHARKTYSDEFRRQAVDLFESTPGATLKGIAADLGITRGALAQWVRVLGAGTTTCAVNAACASGGPNTSGAAWSWFGSRWPAVSRLPVG